MSLRLSQLDNLYQRARTIRDEVMRNANTALRIGSLFYDIIAALASVSIEELYQKFLSKEEDDATTHKLTMGEAAVTGDATVGGDMSVDGDMTIGGDSVVEGKEVVKGAAGTEWGDDEFEVGTSGAKIWKENSGWHGQLDYLFVTKKFTVKELEIMHESHIGGSLVISAANCVADDVEFIENGGVFGDLYKVWFLAVDADGKRVYNMWKQGDLARCQTANLCDGNNEISNHYYWRLVTSVSTAPVERGDGKLYHYIQFEDAPAFRDEGSDVPLAGDEIVQMGNPSDESRQGVIMLTSVLNGVQVSVPFIRIYKGVGSIERDSGGNITRGMFQMPQARIDMNPFDPRMDVSQLTITAQGGSTKTIDEYIREREPNGVLVITADTDDEPSTDDDFLDECLETLELEQKEDMVGAFYVTTDWRIWKYQENYTWQEVTDTNLKSLLEEFVEQQGEIEDAKDRLDALELRTTTRALQDIIASYASDNLVEKTTFNTWKEGVELYTTWLDPVKQAAGTTGLLTYLNSLFVGTASVAFDGQGNITNIDKSGLVTETGFAALFASNVTDPRYDVATKAFVAAAVSAGVSSITISADRVNISSGNKTLGNVFSLDGETGDVTMHDLYARNITLEGVLNNLAQTLSLANLSQYGYVEGSILYLNPLKIGQYLYFDWENAYAELGIISIFLPYACSEAGSYVPEIGGYKEAGENFTLEEMRQMVGKKIVFMPQTPESGNPRLISKDKMLYNRYTFFDLLDSQSDIEQGLRSGDLNKFDSSDPNKLRTTLTDELRICQNGQYDLPTGESSCLYLECKVGMYRNFECIYWEISRKGYALVEEDES